MGDYHYFEGPRFQGNSGFSFCNALLAADASLLAYGRNGETRMTEADDPFDILDDSDLLLVRQQALGGRTAGRVHQGFQDYLPEVWDRVADVVGDYRAMNPAQEICITGHSLGAALATITFQQLRDQHTSLYTYGCPRAGDHEFAGDVSAMALTHGCYRFVDNEDVVTHVASPSILLPYAHPKCAMLWIDGAGAIIENPPDPPGDSQDFTDLGLDFLRGQIVDPLPLPLADHSLIRFCHWIGQACIQ